jgi:hypothetical protein
MPRGRPRKTGDVLLRSAELIGWALGGIEREIVQTRDRLAVLTARANQLRKQVGRKASQASGAAAAAAFGAPQPVGRKRRRRHMSPEARKRISEMMKKRWAERRRGK